MPAETIPFLSVTGSEPNEVALAEVSAGAETPILYTIEEAARLLRLGRTTLYELMWTDQLVPIRIGRRVRFSRASLERFVEERAKRA